jgi:hypothetical protein
LRQHYLRMRLYPNSNPSCRYLMRIFVGSSESFYLQVRIVDNPKTLHQATNKSKIKLIVLILVVFNGS